MDNRLFGKTILIGREPVNNRLLISLNVNGKNYFAPIGQPGSVSGGVSRCIPNENKAHCRLQIDANGVMTLENAKPENVTFIDGTQIMKKRVGENCTVEMGQYKYRVSMAEIINTATLIADKTIKKEVVVPEFDIRPLKAVYDDYHEKQLALKIRQRNLNLKRSIAPIFTIGSGVFSRLPNLGNELSDIATLLFVIGLVATIWSFYNGYKDKSIEEGERITEEFQRKYICPNPECRHFLGMRPYHLLQQDNNCMYCKCKFKK